MKLLTCENIKLAFARFPMKALGNDNYSLNYEN